MAGILMPETTSATVAGATREMEKEKEKSALRKAIRKWKDRLKPPSRPSSSNTSVTSASFIQATPAWATPTYAASLGDYFAPTTQTTIHSPNDPRNANTPSASNSASASASASNSISNSTSSSPQSTSRKRPPKWRRNTAPADFFENNSVSGSVNNSARASREDLDLALQPINTITTTITATAAPPPKSSLRYKFSSAAAMAASKRSSSSQHSQQGQFQQQQQQQRMPPQRLQYRPLLSQMPVARDSIEQQNGPGTAKKSLDGRRIEQDLMVQEPEIVRKDSVRRDRPKDGLGNNWREKEKEREKQKRKEKEKKKRRDQEWMVMGGINVGMHC